MTRKKAPSQPSVSDARRERERAEMTERIMTAAREMFVRDGYEAVTLRRIAQAVEYSPASIYQYFRDKQALVMEIIRTDSESLRSHLLECASIEDPLEMVVELARRYAAWGIAHPNHYRLMLSPPPAMAEQNRELRKRETPPLEQEALHILGNVVRRGLREDRLRPAHSDPSLVASALWAGIHGLIMLEISMTAKDRAILGIEDASFEARFNTLLEVYRQGLLKLPHTIPDESR